MRAIVRDRYGPGEQVLQLVDLPRPSPAADEVLVRVRATSLNRGDRYTVEGIPLPFRMMLGPFRPRARQLGMDFAGDVVEIGASVQDVAVGDAVYGQQDLGSTWAEYASIPASLVAPKPTDLTYVEAAAVPVSAFTALQGLRDAGGLQPGQRVLLNGSTGAVGTFAVQIARALGAEVTAVCSERHLDLVRDLGADTVIPNERQDFLEAGGTFDVVFDIVGNHGLLAYRRIMAPGGTFVPVGGPSGFWLGPAGHLLRTQLLRPFVRQRVRSFVGTPNRPDLLALTELIEAGKLRPSIERVFELAELPEAMRYLVHGRPGAKVAIEVA